MRVLFIDPGKATGWFVFNNRSSSTLGGEASHGNFLAWMDPFGNRGASGPLTGWYLDRVVCEGFDIDQETSQKVSLTTDKPLWSIEQIGCLRFWCGRMGIPFEIQSRTAKAFDKDGSKLKKLGWWDPADGVKGEAGHRRDAARHAVKWCVDHGLIDGSALL